jgi:hypothetical protein
MAGALVPYPPLPGSVPVPAIIADAGDKASEHFLEYFAATISNKNTRAAYAQAVAQFLPMNPSSLAVGSMDFSLAILPKSSPFFSLPIIWSASSSERTMITCKGTAFLATLTIECGESARERRPPSETDSRLWQRPRPSTTISLSAESSSAGISVAAT